MNTKLQSRNFKVLLVAFFAALFTMNTVSADDSNKPEPPKPNVETTATETTTTTTTNAQEATKKVGGNGWFDEWNSAGYIIIYILAVIAIAGLGYYFWIYKKEDETN